MSEYKKMRKIKKERRDKERVGKIKPRGVYTECQQRIGQDLIFPN